ncbi:alpha- and gamma-adaptin-binding protein p34-like [Elysia marginata]|uniref:Alpha- and gamma-adaptin-binding protein p34-like n=1 Tax=Elysia marginata TaxID=1093978 RepID=A0AAV4IL58_9GAST|nr:alpha- and gamma-adaptin-binding protein p34-like [Elysia marginata]
MALPCALFSSSSTDFEPQELVKQILKVSQLPAPSLTTPEIKSYEWHINTKYYSTKIQLSTTDKRTIGDKEFAESVEAFIHYFDPTVPDSFSLATAWLPYLSHIEPEVLMLVCKCAKDSDAVGRKTTLAWCVENGFELVELEPELDSEDEDDDFPETTGLARIIQALHAHTWPNLQMKDSPPVQSPLVRQMMKEQKLLNKELEMRSDVNSKQTSTLGQNSTENEISTSLNSIEASNSSSPSSSTNGTEMKTSSEASASERKSCDSKSNGKESESDSGVLLPDDIDWTSFIGAVASDGTNEDAQLGDKDLGVDEFEDLFRKLKVMKDRAENLAPDERKKYAEKVAISFWNAIGGDEDELGDLDADSD